MQGEKSQALLRDIARLFIKYSLSDWQIVLSQLRDGGASHRQLAEAIEQLKAITYRTLPAGPSRPRPVTKTAWPVAELSKIDSSRAAIIQEIYDAVQARKIVLTLRDLREIHSKAGGKGEIPSKRDPAIRFVLTYLSQLPPDRFHDSLRALTERQCDLGADYSRWFELIYGNTRS